MSTESEPKRESNLDRSTIKMTPAGRRYVGFLAIFNNGNSDRLKAYIQDNFAPESLAQVSVDALMEQFARIYRETGGMVVQEVTPDGDHKITLHLKAREHDSYYHDEMTVSEDFPHKILTYRHGPAQ